MSQFEPSTSPVRNRNSVRPNLVVRPIHPDDATDIYAIISDPKVAVGADWIPVKEYLQIKEWAANPNTEQHRLVAEMNGTVVGVGTISLKQRQNPRRSHSAGLGMMVHPNYWGQGIGTCLMESILDLADNWLNLKRIDLDVNVDNSAGIRLYKKFGFVVEGTKRYHIYGDGRWTDSYFMARLK